MSGSRIPVVALVMVPFILGCRLPGMEGIAPRSLVTSRQLSQQGVAALEREQWEHADDLLGQAVRACPTNPDAHRNYAEARWNRGFREEALKELEAARRLAPDDATTVARIAEMRLAMGQTETAWQDAQRAIALDPKLASAWAARAQVLRATGNPTQALADYHRALSLGPDDRRVPCEIATLYLELNQPQRALLAIEGLADKYSPGDEPQDVLYYQGVSYLALNRYDDAVESLSAASLHQRPTAEILYRLAQAQLAAGHPTQAAASADQALAIDPNFKPARALLDQPQLARQPESLQRR